MKQICFLTYISRSGSTLLSRLLSEYNDIGVTVESQFMENLLYLKRSFEKNGDVGKLFCKLEKLGRFSNLRINFSDFTRHFNKKTENKISYIAECILEAYFAREKPEAKVWIVKDGYHGYYLNQISNELPQAKFLHIVRDGRAVLNSAEKTIDSYTQKPMSTDPLLIARAWRKLITCVDNFKGKYPDSIFEVRYEDLIINKDEELYKIRKFLGLNNGTVEKKNSIITNYYDKIPQIEKSMHALVNKDPEIMRINAWKDELSEKNQIIFEYVAKDVLIKKGYEVNLNKRILPSHDEMIYRSVLMCIDNMLRIKRWIKYAFDFKLLRIIVKKKLLTFKERYFIN